MPTGSDAVAAGASPRSRLEAWHRRCDILDGEVQAARRYTPPSRRRPRGDNDTASAPYRRQATRGGFAASLMRRLVGTNKPQ